jgi:hypothetical protein
MDNIYRDLLHVSHLGFYTKKPLNLFRIRDDNEAALKVYGVSADRCQLNTIYADSKRITMFNILTVQY